MHERFQVTIQGVTSGRRDRPILLISFSGEEIAHPKLRLSHSEDEGKSVTLLTIAIAPRALHPAH